MPGTRPLGSIDLPYLQVFTDRHGKRRTYYRRRGRTVSLPGEPGSPEWSEAYWTARASDDRASARHAQASSRTFDALIRTYYSSPDFISLRDSTKRTYRCDLDSFAAEYGTLPVAGLKYRHVLKMMGDMADRPAAANKRLKRLRQVLAMARRMGWVKDDPTEGVKSYRLGEIHTWTPEEHKAFLDHWGPGSMARLAYMAHLHTVQRRSDVCRLPMPRTQVEGFRLTQVKTSKPLVLPIVDVLWREIELHPRRMMLLVTAHGEPFGSAASYGNWFRKRCSDAGLPARCSSHGLRKAGAAELADAGCSAHEIQAITGHASLSEVERYTRAANQKRLAESAMAKRSGNDGVSNP